MNRKLNLLNDITHHDMLNQLSALNSLLGLTGEQIADTGDQNIPDPGRSGARHHPGTDRIFPRLPDDRGGISTVAGSFMYYRADPGHLKIGELVIDESSRGLEIYADTLLEKVFFNLMDNSVRHAKVPGYPYCGRKKRRTFPAYVPG